MSSPQGFVAIPRPGETIAGKYALVRQIGVGGMGVVFEATHLRLRQKLAVKMLRPEALASPDVVTRFEREARAAAALRGPNVARVVDVDVTPGGAPYMVMEYLEGRDLRDELHARGRLPVHEAVIWVMYACSALAEAHALGIVHRDLKPSNLFLAEQAGTRSLKVLDFGISKLLDETDGGVTMTQATFGTPVYMSPEHVRSAKHVDARTDVWSLGVILYELLAGRTPFDGPSPTAIVVAVATEPVPSLRALRPEVPPGLEAVVLRALRKDPAERIPTVGAFMEALAPFAASGEGALLDTTEPSLAALLPARAALARGGAGDTDWTGSAPSFLPPSGRRPAVWLGGAGVVLFATAAFIWLRRPAPRDAAPTPSADEELAQPPAPRPGAPALAAASAPDPRNVASAAGAEAGEAAPGAPSASTRLLAPPPPPPPPTAGRAGGRGTAPSTPSASAPPPPRTTSTATAVQPPTSTATAVPPPPPRDNPKHL